MAYMKGLKICLDAGHGGSDPGAVNGSRLEKNDTLKFVKRLGKVLEANEATVYYTRTTDIYHSPEEKARKANATDAKYFISVHRNAAAATAKGVEVLVYSNTGKKAVIAKDICVRHAGCGFVNRDVKENPKLVVLNSTNMEAMLLEVGFISNSSDNTLFDRKFNLLVDEAARALAKAENMNFKSIP